MQVKDYARRIEAVDRDVAKLKETTATKKQLSDLKVDFRKLYVSGWIETEKGFTENVFARIRLISNISN